MSDRVRIKFEPASPVMNPNSDDDDTRSTVILYNKDLDEDSEEDVKPVILSLRTEGCIELSSDEEASPMRIRDRRTSAGQSSTATVATSFSTIDRRSSAREVSSNAPSSLPRLVLREVETQTDPEVKATTDVATSVDEELGAKKDISVNTDVKTADVGINVDVEEVLLNTVEAMDVDEPEDTTVESSEKDEAAKEEADKIYYRCKICSCYYLSVKLLYKHSMAQHNKAFNDVQKVQYDMKCQFCNSAYVFATYNKHIKSKHADRFNKNANTRRNDLSGPYECTICNIKFLSYNEGKRHRKVHANVEQKFILRKIRDNNTPTSSKAVKVEKPPSQTPSYKNPIPKAFLFQCPKCQLNFFNYRNGLRHRIVCERGDNKNGVIVNCAKCERRFLSVHIRGHYQQHEWSNNFKIQPIVDGIEHKILYRCMKCKVCMEERSCRLHFQYGCKAVGIPCTLCNNKIDKDFMSKHKEAHSRMGLTKDEIILVDVCD